MKTHDLNDPALFRNLELLILASSSPRRKELLQALGVVFLIQVSGVDEEMSTAEAPEIQATRCAVRKARAVSLARPDAWVLGADTVVVLKGRVFGKPQDVEEAFEMLRQLSGRKHEVMTGICLVHETRRVLRETCIMTEVQFKHLSDAEIRAYIDTREPLDKAGAYGIQGRGGFLVQAIRGSYTNVVGLPLCETLEWLMEERVIAPVMSPMIRL